MIYSNQNLTANFEVFLKSQLAQLANPSPILNIWQFNDDLASHRYIKMKQKMGQKLGLDIRIQKFEASNMSLEVIQKLQNQALIIQLPTPVEVFNGLINGENFWDGIFDIDFLNYQKAALYWKIGMLPPTLLAIDLVLKEILWQKTFEPSFLTKSLSLEGQTVAVIGQGQLVGSFMVKYLIDRGATIISLNKFTEAAPKLCTLANIVICATGVAELVGEEFLQKGALVIDAGTSESGGALKGDLNYSALNSDNYTLCSSPGGIGPVTVLGIFWNLLQFSSLQEKGLLV